MFIMLMIFFFLQYCVLKIIPLLSQLRENQVKSDQLLKCTIMMTLGNNTLTII